MVVIETSLSEAEYAHIFKEAMRSYSSNNLSTEGLGIFKGVEKDGVTVRLRLEGANLRITPVEIPKEEPAPKPEPTLPKAKKRDYKDE